MQSILKRINHKNSIGYSIRIKAVIIVVMSIFFIGGLVSLREIYAAEEVSSGTCGDSATWSLNDEGTLTIDGFGAMEDYQSESSTPWCYNKDEIKRIVIRDDITRIGARAFYNCINVTEIEIGNSVESIGSWALCNMNSLEELIIPQSVVSLETSAIRFCGSLHNIGFMGDAPVVGSYVFSDCSEDLTLSNHFNSSGWDSDPWMSYDMNTVHFNALDSILSSPTCIETGFSKYKCKVCGEISVLETPALGHDYVDGVCIRCGDEIIASGEGWDLYRSGLLDLRTMPSFNGDSAPWKNYSSMITRVEIGENVTNIRSYAFSGCSNLENINIPENVTSIGSGALYGCGNLKRITIPFTGNTINSTGENALFGYIFGTASYAGGVETSQHYESSDVTYCIPARLTDVTIKSRVPDYSFNNCSGLNSVTISDGATSIGNRAFQKCTGLTNIAIPDSVTTIGSYAFLGCSSLNNIKIPDTVTSIGNGAFISCIGLKSITIPDGITSIGSGTFQECSGLTSITIPDTVTSVGKQAFDSCASLTSITIPASVTSIGIAAFIRCNQLTSINVEPSNLNYSSFGGCLYNKNKTELICCPAGTHTSNFTAFSNSVIAIGDDAFYGCNGITGITIPNSVVQIGENAFNECSSLTNITLSNSLQSIGKNAFHNCGALKSITFPNSLQSVAEYAFNKCSSLTALIIPKNVSSIGERAFFECSNLESIDVDSANKYFSSIDGCLYNSNTFIFCPDNYKETKVTLSNRVERIQSDAFMNCSNIVSVVIPSSVSTIGSRAFNNCPELKYIFFGGTQSQWQQLWNTPTNVSVHYQATDHVYGDWVIAAEPTCTADGSRYRECIVCSYRLIEPISNRHTYGSWMLANEPTCTEDGSKERICSACGNKEIEIIPATGHNYDNWTIIAEPTCTEDGLKERICSNCGDKETEKIDVLGHNWDEGNVTTQPTCTEEGVRTFICSRCKGTRTESVSALGHDFATVFTVDIEATCTEEGAKSRHCTNANCDAKTDVTPIPKIDHTYSVWTIITEATCTTDGSKEKVCTVCGDKATETIPAIGHNYAEEFTVDKEPTCTEKGSKSRHCINANCEDKTEVTEISANGHSFGNWIEIIPSSCEDSGFQKRICKVCGYAETQYMDPSGHQWDEDYSVDAEPTCTENGSKSRHCSNCEAVIDSKVIPATGHIGNWETKKEPTCKEPGSKEMICEVCGSFSEAIIPAKGHAWSNDPTIDKEATCVEAGAQSIHCERCDNTKNSETIPALGHEWNDKATVDKPATCTDAGAESIHCARCDIIKDKSERSIPATGHNYGSWITMKVSTELDAGQQSHTCSTCGATETQAIAQLAPTLPSVKISKPKAAKKSATIKWKKVSKKNQKKIAKIEIQYSLDKNFKTGVKTITAKKSAASKKISKLTSKKTYYVRVRSYKKDKKGAHVSKWSGVKAVKVK